MKKIGLLILILTIFSCDKKENNRLEVYNYTLLEPLLNKEDDKTYVINFWATWCKPCVKELPVFEKLNSEYKKKGVEVILVSLDFPNQIDDVLLPFIQKEKLKSEVILLDDPDQNNWIPKIDEKWTGSIPATLIYNKNSREFYEQSFTYTELKQKLENFLK